MGSTLQLLGKIGVPPVKTHTCACRVSAQTGETPILPDCGMEATPPLRRQSRNHNAP